LEKKKNQEVESVEKTQYNKKKRKHVKHEDVKIVTKEQISKLNSIIVIDENSMPMDGYNIET
jgi:high-affinity K+ transport system ATPase subunit B